MIDYLDKFVEQGIKEGRFTEQQAAEDLELSLWYGFATTILIFTLPITAHLR